MAWRMYTYQTSEVSRQYTGSTDRARLLRNYRYSPSRWPVLPPSMRWLLGPRRWTRDERMRVLLQVGLVGRV